MWIVDKLLPMRVIVIGLFFSIASAGESASNSFDGTKAYFELQDLANTYLKYEEPTGNFSRSEDRLKSFMNKYNNKKGDKLSDEDVTRVVTLCKQTLVPGIQSNLSKLMRWKLTNRKQISDEEMEIRLAFFKEAETKVIRVIARALKGKVDSLSFRRSREFWLENQRYNLMGYSDIMKQALKDKLGSLDNIKLYCKLPLEKDEKSGVLKLLKDNKKIQKPRRDYLAICARLGDEKAETELLKTFSEYLSNYFEFSSSRRDVFGNMSELCDALAYAGTRKCAVLLVKSLASSAQYISLRGNVSIQKPVMKALAKMYPKEFDEMFQVGNPNLKIPLGRNSQSRFEVWIHKYGLVGAPADRKKQLELCRDLGSLTRFEKFCTDRFGELDWSAEDMWFSFQFSLFLDQKFRNKHSMPKFVKIGKNREIRPYKP